MKSTLDVDLDDKIVYESGKYYEITVRPYKQDSIKPLRFISATQALRDLMQTIDIKYIFIPELSHCKYSYDSMSPRHTYVHWHGIIYLENKDQLYDWLLTGFNKLAKFYHIQLNPFRGQEWKEYIIKQCTYIPKKFRCCNMSKNLLIVSNPPSED